MPYEIKSAPDFAIIDFTLADGESVVSESGAMVSMSSNVKMKTEARGGILAAAKRKLLGGESIFQNTYTAEGGEGHVMLAPGSPGDRRRWRATARAGLTAPSAAQTISMASSRPCRSLSAQPPGRLCIACPIDAGPTPCPEASPRDSPRD